MIILPLVIISVLSGLLVISAVLTYGTRPTPHPPGWAPPPEMIGIVRRMDAGRHITDTEKNALEAWVMAHPEQWDAWSWSHPNTNPAAVSRDDNTNTTNQ